MSDKDEEKAVSTPVQSPMEHQQKELFQELSQEQTEAEQALPDNQKRSIGETQTDE